MKKETYFQWFKKTYNYGWLLAILALIVVAAVKEYNSEVPSNALMPIGFGAVLFLIIFALTFYQYKKGDNTRFR